MALWDPRLTPVERAEAPLYGQVITLTYTETRAQTPTLERQAIVIPPRTERSQLVVVSQTDVGIWCEPDETGLTRNGVLLQSAGDMLVVSAREDHDVVSQAWSLRSSVNVTFGVWIAETYRDTQRMYERAPRRI